MAIGEEELSFSDISHFENTRELSAAAVGLDAWIIPF